MIKIFDLDNCIADDAWRASKIRFTEEDLFLKYHDYFSLSAFDELANTRPLEHSQWIVISARSELYRQITIEWIRRKTQQAQYPGVIHMPLAIYLRQHDDHRPAVEIKRDIAKMILDTLTVPPIIAYDDRPEIVEMYESLGIKACVLQINDPNIIYDPKSHERF